MILLFYNHLVTIILLCSIMHNEAKKTLLGTVRGFWPVGAYTWTDINDKYPKWVEKVIKEFYVCPVIMIE